MRGPIKLYEINVKDMVTAIPVDSGLRNLLQTKRVANYDFNSVRQEVLEFSRNILMDLTFNEKEAIDMFYVERDFNTDLIDPEKILHERIQTHPMIRRALEVL